MSAQGVKRERSDAASNEELTRKVVVTEEVLAALAMAAARRAQVETHNMVRAALRQLVETQDRLRATELELEAVKEMNLRRQEMLDYVRELLEAQLK